MQASRRNATVSQANRVDYTKSAEIRRNVMQQLQSRTRRCIDSVDGYCIVEVGDGRCQRECRGFESHLPLCRTPAASERQPRLTLVPSVSYDHSAAADFVHLPINDLDREGLELTAVDARTCKV